MSKLFLIRHPAVKQISSQPSNKWPLSEKGRQQSHLLAELEWWGSVSNLYSSSEAKTIEASSLIRETHPHLLLESLVNLDEARRPHEFVDDIVYSERVEKFFQNENQPAADGWEPASQVLDRFVATINKIMQEHTENDQNLAIISHGMALTLYRGVVLGQKPAIKDWKLLSMGCWAEVDVKKGILLKDWTRLQSI